MNNKDAPAEDMAGTTRSTSEERVREALQPNYSVPGRGGPFIGAPKQGDNLQTKGGPDRCAGTTPRDRLPFSPRFPPRFPGAYSAP